MYLDRDLYGLRIETVRRIKRYCTNRGIIPISRYKDVWFTTTQMAIILEFDKDYIKTIISNYWRGHSISHYDKIGVGRGVKYSFRVLCKILVDCEVKEDIKSSIVGLLDPTIERYFIRKKDGTVIEKKREIKKLE